MIVNLLTLPKTSKNFRKVVAESSLAFLFLFTAIFGLCPRNVAAQNINATITGRVTDLSKAVVSNASVVLTQTDTGLTLHTKTNSAGLYSFPSLGTGPYRVEVSRQGFNSTQSSLVLTVGQNATVDVVLQVGSVNQTVTVDASSPMLDSQDSNLNFTVGQTQVADLPLNGRNPYALAALSPGIVPGTSFGAGLSQQRGAVIAAATNNFQTNGGIGGSNEILLDGVSIVVCCQGQPAVTPSVEVVDQFKVVTSIPPAQLGRSSGGVLNIVTKAGTNRLHGDIYEFLRNDNLDAAPFFTKRSGHYPIPGRADYRLPHHFNQFGAFVSGPVVVPGIYHGKDKTFFTFGYEGSRNSTSSFHIASVPTLLERAGIFTEDSSLLYDPYNITQTAPGKYKRALLPAGCNATQCFPAGKGVANINPLSKQLLQFLPEPNEPGITSNYQYSLGIQDSENQYNFRVDQILSGKDRAFVRGTKDNNIHHQNDIFNRASGPTSVTQNLANYLFALSEVHTFSPNLILQGTYGFAQQRNENRPNNLVGFNSANYGFSSNFISDQQLKGLPNIGISGTSAMTYASNLGLADQYTHVLALSVILQRGKHNITAGFDGRLVKFMSYGLSNPAGSYTFNSTLTNGPDPTLAAASGVTGFDSFAAFLIGTPTSVSLARQYTQAFTQLYHAYYVQDDWRFLRNLTLNLGVRYAIDPGFHVRHNYWADFDPNADNPLSQASGVPFKGGAQFLGVGSNPTTMWRTQYNHLAPRIGVAYSPNPTTVFRGGYGVIFLPSTRFYGAQTLGFTYSTNITNLNTSVPTNTIDNPFPTGVSLPPGPSAGVEANTFTGIGGLIYDQPGPYQQQWNFGVQQALTPKLAMYINYAGGHGVHLPVNYRPNDLLPSSFGAPGDTAQVTYLNTKVPNPFARFVTTGNFAAATIPRVQLLSAYPQYGLNTNMASSAMIYNFYDIGSASYNSMQTGMRYHGGKLNATVYFTWSKLIGNVSDLVNGFLNSDGNPGIQNYHLLKQYERSIMPTDTPHRVVGALNYRLPFGRGERFGSQISQWEDLIVGGWKLNFLGSIQSGLPLNVTSSGGPQYSGSRPNFVPGVNPLTSGSLYSRLGNYLNPNAFRLAQSFELGDVPRNSGAIRSPVIFQDDLSALKDFNIRESWKLQFRLEAFNFLNKAQFGLPASTFNSVGFGQVTSQSNQPRQVQVAAKLFF